MTTDTVKSNSDVGVKVSMKGRVSKDAGAFGSLGRWRSLFPA